MTHDTRGDLAGSSILVTGGTGSFGHAFIPFALEHLGPDRLIVYSRDELKQSELRQRFAGESRLRYFIGDVRDVDRLRRALDGVDVIVHAAALKQVDTAEYNPFECIQTNVMGAQNVIEAAIDQNVERVVALSTDKASSPVNLYGASKLCSDKLFVAGNHYAAHSRTRFSVVRYGNVLGSRGSVVPYWRELAARGEALPVTDRAMTRFWVTLDQAVRIVGDTLLSMRGGELFVPKLPSMRVTDLAEAIAPGAPLREIGIRPGEKLHEEMISVDDARRAREYEGHFIVHPVLAEWFGDEAALEGKPLPPGFSYNSATNDQWLDVETLRDLLGLDALAETRP